MADTSWTTHVPRHTDLFGLVAQGQRLVGRITDAWDAWFRDVHDRLDALAQVVVEATQTDLAAAAPETVLVSDGQPGALYRLAAWLKVRQAASTSGTVTLTLSWFDRAAQPASATVTLATNVRGEQANLVALATPDFGAPVRYRVSYASVGATPLRYDVGVAVERMGMGVAA